MRILIACECSGIVRRAFHDKGHDVVSCDLNPAADDSPYHYQGDVRDLLGMQWDMIIAHPPCTYLTNSAAWCFKDEQTKRQTPGVLYGAERRAAREEAAKFATMLWNQPARIVVIENPVGYLSRVIGKPAQIVQPWQFGDDASKATCLWLKGVQPLQVLPEELQAQPRIVMKDGKEYRRWANQTDSGQSNVAPSPDRGAIRSVTYQGIANAMAEQWG